MSSVEDPTVFAAVRRCLGVLAELAARENSSAAGGLAYVASQSLDAESEFGGHEFLPTVVQVLSRADDLPAIPSPSLQALTSALAQGERGMILSSIERLYDDLGREVETVAPLASLESDLQVLDARYGDPLLHRPELRELSVIDHRSLGGRVTGLLLQQLRPFLADDCEHNLSLAMARAVADHRDPTFAFLPTVLAFCRPSIEDLSPAVRIAFETTTTALSLFHLSIDQDVEQDAACRLLEHLIVAWQWQRAALGGESPAIPKVLLDDAEASVDALLGDWEGRNRGRWLKGWLWSVNRIAAQLQLLEGDEDEDDPTAIQETYAHARACRRALEAVSQDTPPEAADGLNEIQVACDRIFAAAGIADLPEGEARFGDGRTSLDEPDGAAIGGLILATVAITCCLELPDPAQTGTVRAFFVDPPTDALRQALPGQLLDGELPLDALADVLAQPEAVQMVVLSSLVEDGVRELRAPALSDGDASLEAIKRMLELVASQRKGFLGFGKRKARNGFLNALNFIDSVSI